MGPQVFLSRDVYAVAVEGDLVLLDSLADIYVCIPDGLSELAFCAETQTFAPSTLDVAAALVKSGLAARQAWEPPHATLREAPVRSLAFLPPSRPTPRDAWRLAGCLVDVALHYRGHSLSQILAYVALRRGRLPRPVGDLGTLVRRFYGAAIWLPVSRKCLIRSFVLLRFLQRSGWDAQWVFGVRTWPFGAHCWLQVGDMALDDAAEQLLKYAPIRVA